MYDTLQLIKEHTKKVV